MNLEAFKECKTSSFLAHPQLFGNTSLQTKVFKESTSGILTLEWVLANQNK